MTDDLDYDDTELEPGEAERMGGLLILSLMLADMITHPEGARRLSGMLDG